MEIVGLLSSVVQHLFIKEIEVRDQNLDVNVGRLKEDCKLILEYLDPGFAHYKGLEFSSYLLKCTNKDVQFERQRKAQVPRGK